MSTRQAGRMEREPMPFGERYAQRAALGYAGIALFIVFGVIPADRWFPFLAMLVFMACSYFFRRRQMHDERRRNETMEDERDRDILARSLAWFRVAASAWALGLAVLLAIPATRQVLPQGHFALPSLLLLGLVLSHLVEQSAVAWAYRKART